MFTAIKFAQDRINQANPRLSYSSVESNMLEGAHSLKFSRSSIRPGRVDSQKLPKFMLILSLVRLFKKSAVSAS